MADAGLMDVLAAALPRPSARCTLVGIDGPDGSGKTVFADRFAAHLRGGGRDVARVGVDDFHNVEAVRYRRGRNSAEGFWLDSFDCARLVADVLVPLGRAGENRYRPAAHDLRSDAVLHPPWVDVAPGTVVVLDGLFLHRDELARFWDLSVFLDVPFAITAARMARRDGTSPDPEHPTMRRYVGAQRIYFATCSPRDRASAVVDNSDHDAPVLTSLRSDGQDDVAGQ